MNETEFGYHIRQALNESAQQLDYKTTLRLEQARAAALARQRTGPIETSVWVPAMQASGKNATVSGGWGFRLGLAGPVFALLIGFLAIYQWQSQKGIARLADIDSAMLTDELPIEAYTDNGFHAYLKSEAGE